MLRSLLRIICMTAFFFALGLARLQGQTMFILKENGALSTQNITTIKKITFTDNSIVLFKTDGKSEQFCDTLVRYLNFENLKSIHSDAGIDLTVKEGDKVMLDGSASSGPFDDALMFNWNAPKGIGLSSATASKPTFTAPEVNMDTTFVLSLVVSDGRNISSLDSVRVRVQNVNKSPKLVSDLVLNVAQNQPFEDTIVGMDPDNDVVSIFIDELPAFISLHKISNNHFVVSGTFPPSYYGKVEYDLTCSDGVSSVQYKLLFDVTGVNSVPSQIELSDLRDEQLVYPSLVSDVVNVDNRDGRFTSFQLYDNFGKCVQSGLLLRKLNVLSMMDSPSGLMMLILRNHSEKLEVKLMKN